MRYAKKNLRSVEDSAVTFGLSETQKARFPRGDLGAEQTGINSGQAGRRAARRAWGVDLRPPRRWRPRDGAEFWGSVPW